jgi:hypothetical protein
MSAAAPPIGVATLVAIQRPSYLLPEESLGHYSSFILRFWVEPPDGVRWGIIQHVSSRDKLRFQLSSEGAMSEILEFIRKHSAGGEVALPFALNFGEAMDGPPLEDGLDGKVAAEREGSEAAN